MRFNSFLRYWERHLDLNPGEITLFWRMSVGLVLLGAAHSVGTVAAEAIILGKGGAAALPGAFEFQQVALLTAAFMYFKWGMEGPPERPFLFAALVSVLAGLVSSVQVQMGVQTSPVVFWGIVQAVFTLSLSHFHNVRGLLLDAQLTKLVLPRMLALLMGGKLLGGLIALLDAGSRPVWSGLAYAALAGTAGLALAWPHRSNPAGRAYGPPTTFRQFWEPVVKSPLSQWAHIAIALVVISERCFELTSGAKLVESIPKKYLGEVLALFTSMGTLAAGALQIFFMGPLIARYGPAVTTIIYPLAALLCAALTWWLPGLTGALVARFTFACLSPAMVDTTYGLLEGGLPVPLARKIRVMKSGVMRPIVTVIVAIVASRYMILSSLTVAAISCVILAWMCLRIPRLYARTWLDLLRHRGSSRVDPGFRPPAVDSALWNEARVNLDSEHADEREAALQLVEAAVSPSTIPQIVPLLETCEDVPARARIARALAHAGWTPAGKLLNNLAQQPALLRAEIYLTGGLAPSQVISAATADLTQNDLAVRASAAGCLMAVGQAPANAAELIDQAVLCDEPNTKCVGLRALVRAGGEVRPEVVLRAVAHTDEQVRKAAVAPLALAKDRDTLLHLVKHDPSAGVRAAAMLVMAREEPTSALDLAAEGLGDRSDRVRHEARELFRAGGEQAMRRIRSLAVDRFQNWVVREQALLLMGSLDPDGGGAWVVAKAAVRRAQRLVDLLNKTEGPRDSIGLRAARALMEDRVAESFYVAIRALTTHKRESFFLTAVDGIRSPNARVRSQALETVHSACPEGLPPGMRALAMEVPYLARLYIGSTLAGCPPNDADGGEVSAAPQVIWVPRAVAPDAEPTRVELLRAEVGNVDAVRAAAIHWALRDLSGKASDEREGPPIVAETLAWLAHPSYPEGMPTIARIAFLKGTEFFSGFGADELQQLAEATQLLHFDSGDTIFRHGDASHELFIVMKGQVEVFTTTDGKPVPIAVLNPGEILGELGLFDGQPRSATAAAKTDAALLSISRADMAAILAQAPLVAMAFLRSLSLRFRKATDAGRNGTRG